MGVARQGQPEMADIVRAVDGLRLGAQHQFVDHAGFRRGRGAVEDAVEQLGPHRLALGQGKAGDAHLVEEVAQRGELFRVGRSCTRYMQA